ncbi:alanine dehydrogenase [Alkalilimnicola ehrlichii]|uniref:alanine dehydrogenase n=1 Tax=Alkalilimnicola ehrlichii TaxID=351052 RepID=A0A3E0X2I2_9GAMM|nr:alanine dehydrogenase [Alkalilimnicola ehrlichii]RFA28374.1 alanine dehydrogenase [Alkalilimnicola ehrlichii]RFA38562.1 alanine dehydrogenase [Alkalilimnicola ehrlichii]
MRIAVPKERKPHEGRVALTPELCRQLINEGANVVLEVGAGQSSGYPDQSYADAGARLERNAEALWREADLVLKVKEPLADEVARLQSGQVLFCYLHLAAAPWLAEALCRSGATAVAFETVTAEHGDSLPLLAPMSAIAGRLAAQVGATLLHSPQGGRGVLLGGIPGVTRGRVVVLGAGHAGWHASHTLAGLGAEVVAFDLKPERLDVVQAIGPNVTGLYAHSAAIEAAVKEADLVIGAVLVPGGRAPIVVSEACVKTMLPGAVICDIAVDQGGCIATTRATDYEQPTYRVHDVVHFAVTNMPGAVARTASQALASRLAPYLLRLLEPEWENDSGLASGINVKAGRLVHPAVAAAVADAKKRG